jgi:hypothetical protein
MAFAEQPLRLFSFTTMAAHTSDFAVHLVGKTIHLSAKNHTGGCAPKRRAASVLDTTKKEEQAR